MQALFGTIYKKKNSTAQLTDGTQFEVSLKEPCSIRRPTLRLSTWNPAWNACYIPEFLRYYYVTDVVSSLGMWEVSLISDVLASFKNDIMNTYDYVNRGGSGYDVMIADPDVGKSTKVTVYESRFEDFIDSDPGDFVLYVAGTGAGSASGAVTAYAMTAQQISDFMSYMFDPSKYPTDPSAVTSILPQFIFNPFQYIIKAMYIPGTFLVISDASNIKYGWFESGAQGHIVASDNSKISANVNIPWPVDDFRRATNCVVKVYVPYFGLITLDAHELQWAESINVIIDCDIFTGVGTLNIYVPGRGTRIYYAQSKIGAEIPLISMDMNPMNASMSFLSSVMSAASLNPVGTASSLTNAFNNLTPHASYVGNFGTKNVYSYGTDLVCYVEYNESVCEPDSITELVGRPVEKPMTFSECGGFVQSNTAHIPISGYDGECDELNRFIKEGVYLV